MKGAIARRSMSGKSAERLSFAEQIVEDERGEFDEECNRLLVGYQQGDADAFAALYTKCYDRIYRYAKVALKDADEALDVAQDVFTAGLPALLEFEVGAGPSVRAWLFRVAHNMVVNRRRDLAWFTATEPETMETLIDEGQEGPSMEEIADVFGWTKDDDLDILLGLLPPQQRTVLFLHYSGQFELKEIAEILNKTERSVYDLHGRAMRNLRRRMAKNGRRWQRIASLTRIKYAPVLAKRRFALQGSFRPASEILGGARHPYRR